MKKLIIFAISVCFLFSCNELKEGPLTPHDPGFISQDGFQFPEIEIEPLNDRAPISGNKVYQQAIRMAGEIQNFHWDMADAYTLWSAVVAGDSTIAIGYQPEGFANISDNLHVIDLSSNEWKHARAYTLTYILQELNDLYPGRTFTESDIETEIDHPENLPILWLKVSDYEIIAKLQKLPTIWFIEPFGYDLDPYYLSANSRSVGCGDGGNFNLNTSYYSSVSSTYSDSKVSWHLDRHRVKQAWSKSQGDNVVIGIVDTGIDPDQNLLSNPKFTFGPSASRTISKAWTYNGAWNNQDDPDDRCGHGTTIAGMIGGPVNNDGAITGVAYKADLISYRVANGVHLNTSGEKAAFIDALDDLKANSNVKVVNISMGKFNNVSSIKAAVDQIVNSGKMLVCAAGSGCLGGIYPAKYSNTIAATGVKWDAWDPLGTSLEAASCNAKGSHVTFGTYIQRESNGNWALGMKTDSYAPRVAKGSSAAAALVSGVAALVWSANPILTKAQVIQILKESGSYYPNPNSNFGYGVIDANDAVNAAISLASLPLNVSISGPSFISSSGNYSWNSQVSNASGTKTYKWYWNGTLVSSNINYSRYISTNGIYNSDQLKLVVTTSSGQSSTQTLTIYNI